MRSSLTFIAITCIMQPLCAQTTEDNYVKAYKAQVPLVGDISAVNKKDSVGESIVYYDGLGREVQSVGKMASPLGVDLVTFSTYDGYGKKTKTYLPYPSGESNGNYKPDALTNQQSFYNTQFNAADAARAYTQQVMEHNELARVLEQSSPGDAWKIGSNHTVKKQYLSNTVTDSIYHFNYNESTGAVSVSPGAGGKYAPNMLSCSKTIDEEQNESLEFVDKEGKVICKKIRLAANIYASTYYVYDIAGNLVTVIPPEGLKSIRKLINQQ